MDIIFINDLVVKTLVGINPKERQQQQEIGIDLEIATDFKQAAINDDIKYTLDYDTLVNRIKQFVAHSKYNLLETLAERLAELLMKEFPIHGLRLRVCKFNAVPNTKITGVLIQRGIFQYLEA